MKWALAIAAALALLVPAAASADGPGAVLGTVSPVSVATEVEICIVEPQPSETCTFPEADGTYRLGGLTLQPTRIEFTPSYRSHYLKQYWDHKANLVEAATISLTTITKEAKNINADLTLGSEIEGTVSAVLGGTLEGVEVCALNAAKRTSVGCTETNALGDYALPAIPPGIYKVVFRGKGRSAAYSPLYYENSTSFSGATSITLASGETKTSVDGDLSRGATISGSVIAPSAGPLSGISVCLFAVAVAAARPERCMYSDQSGAYAFEGTPAGAYQVGFSLTSGEIGGESSPSSADDGYLTQYYRGVSNRSEAQTLTLAGEQTDAGVNAQLSAFPVAPPAPRPPAVPTNVVAAPTLITEPVKPKTLKCKKGFVKKKVKGVERCVKKPAKKHRKQPAKKHRKQTKKHGTGAKNPNGRD